MNNGASNEISPEMLTAVATSPQFMQAFQAAWQQQQNAGSASGFPQASQPQQISQNPFLQIFNPQPSATPQSFLQQLFPQPLQGSMNFMQMLPLLALMTQATQGQASVQQPQLQAQPAVIRIEFSDTLDAELASRVRDSRRNRASLKLAVERMAEVRPFLSPRLRLFTPYYPSADPWSHSRGLEGLFRRARRHHLQDCGS
jgi:hypothetical protein